MAARREEAERRVLLVAVRGREVNSDRESAKAVKMTTNDGTTKALLQRFIDKESVRVSRSLPLLRGGHLLWGLLLSCGLQAMQISLK